MGDTGEAADGIFLRSHFDTISLSVYHAGTSTESPAMSHPDPVAEQNRKTSRKRLRRIVLVVSLLIVAPFVVAFTDWFLTRRQGETKRDDFAKYLDATDPDWRIPALTEKRNDGLPPPHLNSADRALALAAQIPRDFRDPIPMSKYRAERDEGPALPTKVVDWWSELPLGILPADSDVEVNRTAWIDNRTLCEEARRFRCEPSSGFCLTYSEPALFGTLLSHLDQLYVLPDLLAFDAVMLALDGRAEGSFDAILAMIACGWVIGDEPCWVSQGSRARLIDNATERAEQCLGWCTVSDSKLAELQSACAKEAVEPRLCHALRGERAVQFRQMEYLDRGAVRFSSLVPLDLGRTRNAADDIFILKGLPAEQALSLEFMTQAIKAAAQLPGRNRAAQFADIENRLSLIPKSEWPVLQLLLPPLKILDQRDTRSVARLRCAVVALACERYRLREKRYPKALADLPKDLLADVPLDPFSDQPLQYRLTADGCDVSSVGGGSLPPSSDRLDLGFRLLLPEDRRQPPRKRGE